MAEHVIAATPDADSSPDFFGIVYSIAALHEPLSLNREFSFHSTEFYIAKTQDEFLRLPQLYSCHIDSPRIGYRISL